MLHWLGVTPSYSRPRVSDDNAYAEALFRTAKYRPAFSTQGFNDLDAAPTWAAEFIRWYNVDHRHSGICYVSPAQRHAGEDHAVLAARHRVYLDAKTRNPSHWSRGPQTLPVVLHSIAASLFHLALGTKTPAALAQRTRVRFQNSF